MKYTLDTEFYEKPGSIEMISIGIVAEDGREYYAESALFDWRLCDPSGPFTQNSTQKWLWKNVRPHVLPIDYRKLPSQIGIEILAFVSEPNRRKQPVDRPEFWGYFADYDWVVFCWLYGSMIDLPKRYPMYCRDLKQVMDANHIARSDLPQQDKQHKAIDDAHWNMKVLREFMAKGLIS